MASFVRSAKAEYWQGERSTNCMPGLARRLSSAVSISAARFLFLAALFVADRVDRPPVVGMVLEPAVGEELVEFVAGHRFPVSRLTEGLAVAEGGQMREEVLQPREGFDSIQLGTRHQRVEVGCVAPGTFISHEQVATANRRELDESTASCQ